MDVTGTTLARFIEQYRDVSGINVTVDWPNLEVVGVTGDLPVTLVLHDVPARAVLRQGLDHCTISEFDPLDYVVTEGVIHVTTQRLARRRHRVSVVYPMRGLVHAMLRPAMYVSAEEAGRHEAQLNRRLDVYFRTMPPQPVFDLSHALSGTNSGGSTPQWVPPAPDDTIDPEIAGIVEELVTLIQNTCGRPEEWHTLGGEVIMSRMVASSLIITAPSDVHGEIRHVLTQLHDMEASRHEQAMRNAAAVRLIADAYHDWVAGRRARAARLVRRAVAIAPGHPVVVAAHRLIED